MTKMCMIIAVVLLGSFLAIAEDPYLSIRTVAGAEAVSGNGDDEPAEMDHGPAMNEKDKGTGKKNDPAGPGQEEGAVNGGGTGDGRVADDRTMFSAGIIAACGWWKPVWGKVTRRLPGGDVDGSYDVDPGFQVGGAAAVRVRSRLWIAAQFLYGRYAAGGTDPVDSSHTVEAENMVDTYDADMQVRFYVLELFYVYGGACYMGYVQHFDDLLVGPAVSPLRTDHSSYHGIGSKFGADYTLPLFWIFSLRGDLSGGSLYGYDRDDEENFTSSVFCEVLAGLEADIPYFSVMINADFYWRFIYYTFHGNDTYRGDGTDHLYGLRIMVRYSL